MKKIVFNSILMLFLFQFGFAQVGIGTTTPNGALDITSSTNGVVVPNIALTARNVSAPVVNPNGGAPVLGTLIWNTATAGTSPNNVVPGFYYWDGSIWVAISGDGGKNWTTTGNSGTVATTNFLGTTDDVDIIFKRKNIRAGFIGNPNTASGNMNTSFGANSLLSPSATGIRNVAIGTNVLSANTTGATNTSVGERSMYSNTQGSDNVAFGTGALYSNLLGQANVAVGRNALTSNVGTTGADAFSNTAVGYVSMKSNTNGSYNSALGRGSLYTNLVGTNNVSLGYQSGYLSTGNNNVFIGNQAGYNEIGNNKLYIEESTAASGTDSSADNALIYGDFGTSPKILRINGQVQVGNPTTTGYALPIVRGTAGQLLQTDGVGGTSWVDTASNVSIVRATLSGNQSLATPSGGWQKINFNTIVFDTKNEFSTTNNQFVAAKAGYYEINAGFHTDAQGNNQYYAIGVYKNGTEYQETSSNHFGNGPVCRNINCIVYLAVGDTIQIWAQNYQSGVTIDSYSGKTFFEIKQIK